MPSKSSYAREQFGDPRIERLQNELKKLRALITACPFIEGALIEDEALTTAAKRVDHRLGREPRGFIVLKASPDAAIGLSASQPSDTANAVNVEASASTTATLWFW
jgi:hypothetical protein